MSPSSAEYFEKVAGQWDTLRTGYFTEEVRKAAIAKARLNPEMVVADVGCGTGFMTFGLAPVVGKVYALDGSAAMVEVAQKNLSQFENVEYRVAELLNLGLESESIDAAFANMYLHHCLSPFEAIQAMVDLLKPGGRLVITDLDAHSFHWLKDEMADEWMGFERDQVRAWFSEAGLAEVDVDCAGQMCCAESQNPVASDYQNRRAEISVFLASGVKPKEK